jgi:hypothetical protein
MCGDSLVFHHRVVGVGVELTGVRGQGELCRLSGGGGRGTRRWEGGEVAVKEMKHVCRNAAEWDG